MAWALPDWRDLPAALGRNPPPPAVPVSAMDRRASPALAAYYASAATPASWATWTDGIPFSLPYWHDQAQFAPIALAVVLSLLLSWMLLPRLFRQDRDALNHLRKGLAQLTETVSDSFRRIDVKAVDQEAIEQVRHRLSQRIESLEEALRRRAHDNEVSDNARKALARRVDTLEATLRSRDADHDALQKLLEQRLAALENGIHVLDGRQLDQEAANVSHRAVALRAESLEEHVRTLDSQTAVLLAAADSGSDAVKRLQQRVSMLPRENRYRALSRVWDKRLRTLEWRIEKTRRACEDRVEAIRPMTPGSMASTKVTPQPELSLSSIDMQETVPPVMLPGACSPSSDDANTLLGEFSPAVTPSSLSRRSTFRSHQRSLSTIDSPRASPTFVKHKTRESPPKWTNYYKNT